MARKRKRGNWIKTIKCRKCGNVKSVSEYYPSFIETNFYVCKECARQYPSQVKKKAIKKPATINNVNVTKANEPSVNKAVAIIRDALGLYLQSAQERHKVEIRAIKELMEVEVESK